MFHILIIEDNDGDVLMFRESLRSAPVAADVVIAVDGEQALRMLGESEFRPDLIVLDLNLPKCDGYTFLERYDSRNGPPVVVFTSSARARDKERALALGANDFISKSSTLETFIESVQGIAQRLAAGASPNRQDHPPGASC